MTLDDTATELLIRLIQRVPMLAIGVKAAEAEGDLPAIAYRHRLPERRHNVAARGNSGRCRDPGGVPTPRPSCRS